MKKQNDDTKTMMIIKIVSKLVIFAFDVDPVREICFFSVFPATRCNKRASQLKKSHTLQNKSQ